MELIELIKVRGTGAGHSHFLTQRAFERAKKWGKLKDFRLAKDVAAIEVEHIEEIEEEVEEITLDEMDSGLDTSYTTDELNEKTVKELKELIKKEFKMIKVPNNATKALLIELIEENQ